MHCAPPPPLFSGLKAQNMGEARIQMHVCIAKKLSLIPFYVEVKTLEPANYDKMTTKYIQKSMKALIFVATGSQVLKLTSHYYLIAKTTQAIILYGNFSLVSVFFMMYFMAKVVKLPVVWNQQILQISVRDKLASC